MSLATRYCDAGCWHAGSAHSRPVCKRQCIEISLDTDWGESCLPHSGRSRAPAPGRVLTHHHLPDTGHPLTEPVAPVAVLRRRAGRPQPATMGPSRSPRNSRADLPPSGRFPATNLDLSSARLGHERALATIRFSSCESESTPRVGQEPRPAAMRRDETTRRQPLWTADRWPLLHPHARHHDRPRRKVPPRPTPSPVSIGLRVGAM